jgi:hypothetical protein
LGINKAKIRFQSPKTELRPQNIKNKFPFKCVISL